MHARPRHRTVSHAGGGVRINSVKAGRVVYLAGLRLSNLCTIHGSSCPCCERSQQGKSSDITQKLYYYFTCCRSRDTLGVAVGAAHLRRTCRAPIMKSDRGSSNSLQRSVRAWSTPPRGVMLRDSAKRESLFVGDPSPIHLLPSVLKTNKRAPQTFGLMVASIRYVT